MIQANQKGLKLKQFRKTLTTWSCLQTSMQNKLATHKIGNKSFLRVEMFRHVKNPNKLEFHSLKNYKETEIRKYLLSFGTGYFVFSLLCTYIQYYNFAYCSVCVQILVSHIREVT